MSAASRDAARTEVSTGTAVLGPTECILRGGYLKEPVVYGRVVAVAGELFVPLWKTDPLLNKFLVAGSINGRPLAGTHFFNSWRTRATRPLTPGSGARRWRRTRRKVSV